jgi:hypothetical protein
MTMTHDVGNLGPGLRQAQKCGGVKVDPPIVLSMFMLSFVFVIVCGLFEWKGIYAGILSSLI